MLYLPRYVSATNPTFAASDEDLLRTSSDHLQLINPDFDSSWIKQYWVRRDQFSQPICEIGFADHIPEMQTSLANMYVTDSHQLHPHDRSISASSELGERVARLVLAKLESSGHEASSGGDARASR